MSGSGLPPIDPLRDEREEGIHNAALRDLGIKPVTPVASRHTGSEEGVRKAFNILDEFCPGWENKGAEVKGSSAGAERRRG